MSTAFSGSRSSKAGSGSIPTIGSAATIRGRCARPQEKVEVKLNCSIEFRGGSLRPVSGSKSSLFGIPYDRPVVGYGGSTVNTLRLWAAAAPDYFDFQRFSGGDFVGALAGNLGAESITRVLYPNDQTTAGQGLRFLQEYFLAACSVADAVRRFSKTNQDWNTFPDKVAIQLNDTHPSVAVAELMRILLDDVQLGWDQAWHITQRTLAYTNHTLLPEALEKWPVEWFEIMLPRHLEIIYEINGRLLAAVRERFPGQEDRASRVSLIEEGPKKQVRMANLAIVGSHSTNGVAAIHSKLLREMTVKDLAEMFPERFNNKTNGVTPRRWLLLANPELASLITETIGDGWITDLSRVESPAPAGRRQIVSGLLPGGQASGQAAIREVVAGRVRANGRCGEHLRLPNQAHPRIQAAAPQCTANHRPLQPAAAEPGRKQCRPARFSSPAKPRRPTSSPRSSSSSSTILPR